MNNLKKCHSDAILVTLSCRRVSCSFKREKKHLLDGKPRISSYKPPAFRIPVHIYLVDYVSCVAFDEDEFYTPQPGRFGTLIVHGLQRVDARNYRNR